MTYCKRGHPRTPENTYRPRGRQRGGECKTCRRDMARERWHQPGRRRPHGSIPRERLWPILERYQKATGRSLEDIAAAGAPYSVITSIHRKSCLNITFESADKILTAIDAPHLWHTELADLYHETAA